MVSSFHRLLIFSKQLVFLIILGELLTGLPVAHPFSTKISALSRTGLAELTEVQASTYLTLLGWSWRMRPCSYELMTASCRQTIDPPVAKRRKYHFYCAIAFEGEVSVLGIMIVVIISSLRKSCLHSIAVRTGKQGGTRWVS